MGLPAIKMQHLLNTSPLRVCVAVFFIPSNIHNLDLHYLYLSSPSCHFYDDVRILELISFFDTDSVSYIDIFHLDI